MANFKSHFIHVAAFAGITFHLPPGTTCPSLASMSAFPETNALASLLDLSRSTLSQDKEAEADLALLLWLRSATLLQCMWRNVW